MMVRHGLGAALILALSVASAPLLAATLPAQDDEVWIEQYLNQRAAKVPAERAVMAPRERFIPVSGLSAHIGDSVRLEMRSGGVRHGTIEGISGGKLKLKAKLHGGYASYSLALASISRVELE